MSRSHRAGGPEYNPATGMRVNVEHTDNPAERSERYQPVPLKEDGINFPYRGIEQHGVPYDHTIPAEYEAAPTSEDLTLVPPPHYAPPQKTPDAIPVTIVAPHQTIRRPWQADQYTVNDGSAHAPLMIVGRNETRHHFVIRNMDAANSIYIGESPNVTSNTGFEIPANTTPPRFTTTDAVYAVCAAGNTANVSVMWEYALEL